MRHLRLIPGIAVASLTATLAAAAALDPPPPPIDPATPPAVRALLDAALADSPLLANLRHLCDGIGGRPTGSPNLERAVDWAVEAFRATGVDRVGTEAFEMPLRWEEGATRLRALAPVADFDLRAVSVAWSPATPAGGLAAPLLDAGRGTAADLEALGARAGGAFLLIQQDEMKSLGDLFAEYVGNPAVLERAAAAGAAGVLFTSTRPRALLYRHQQSFGKLAPLPAAIVAREDALRLTRLLAAGPEVRLRLEMPNRIGGPFVARNVVAEWKGAERPEEIVLIGAHLDSWDLGTGALDNGGNSAMLIDVARAFAASGQRPRRTVRFALFTGEEQGLIGSRAYVRDHAAEIGNTVAVVVYDLGVARVRGYFLGGRPEMAPVLQEILAPLAAWQVDAHPPDAFAGTDHFDFLLAGIPTLVADQDPAPYLPDYHAESDTFDKVDPRALRLQTVVAALTVWGLADRPARPAARLDAAGVAAIVRDRALKVQMQAFGMWDDYVGGRRGLKPPEGALP